MERIFRHLSPFFLYMCFLLIVLKPRRLRNNVSI